MRTPKKTDDQKQYDKAMREKEIRRREKDKEGKRREEEEALKAKTAIWES